MENRFQRVYLAVAIEGVVVDTALAGLWIAAWSWPVREQEWIRWTRYRVGCLIDVGLYPAGRHFPELTDNQRSNARDVRRGHRGALQVAIGSP